jgi:DNA-directed RNA polymerase alpha subunit
MFKFDGIEVSARTYNCLSHSDLKTWEDIAALTDSELFRKLQPNFGRKSLAEVRSIVSSEGEILLLEKQIKVLEQKLAKARWQRDKLRLSSGIPEAAIS